MSVILWKQNVPKAFCICQSHFKEVSLTPGWQGFDGPGEWAWPQVSPGLLIVLVNFWWGLWRVKAMFIMSGGKWRYFYWAPTMAQVLYCCHIKLDLLPLEMERRSLWLVRTQWKFKSDLLPHLSLPLFCTQSTQGRKEVVESGPCVLMPALPPPLAPGSYFNIGCLSGPLDTKDTKVSPTFQSP